MVCQFLLYNKVNQLYVYIYSHIPSLLCLHSYLLIQKSPEHGQRDIKKQYPGQCLHIHNELPLQEGVRRNRLNCQIGFSCLEQKWPRTVREEVKYSRRESVWTLGKTTWRHQMFLQFQLTGYFSAAQSSQCSRFGMSAERFLKRLEMANQGRAQISEERPKKPSPAFSNSLSLPSNTHNS